MAKVSIKAGTASYTVSLFIQDSSSTSGAGLTGLVFNSAGLTAYYVRPGAAAAAISLATQTATGAWSSGGFAEIDSANMPGWYRLDVPDAVIAAGAKSAGIHLKGAANMAPLPVEIELTAWDNQDAVRGGLGALPNAAAAAAGGLPTVDASNHIAGVQGDTKQTGDAFARLGAPAGASVSADVAAVKSQTAAIETDTQDIQTRIPVALVDGRIDSSVGAMAANTLTASALATDAVNEIRTGLSTLDAAGVRGAVGLAAADLDVQLDALDNLGTLSSDTAAAVWAAGTRTLTGFGTLVADIWAAVADSPGVTTLLSRLTAGRAILLDLLTNLNATVSSRSTYDGSDTAGTTTLLGRLTSQRATNLDNLDAAASGIKAKTDLIPASPAAAGDIPSAATIAGAVMNYVTETGWTLVQSIRVILASAGGKLSGAGTSTIPIRDPNDTKDRLTATVDAQGNRTAVTYDKD